MIERPPCGRSVLAWHAFEKQDNGEWVLSLCPPYYASLFGELEPEIAGKRVGTWRESNSGKAMYTCLACLTADEIKRVNRFIEDFGEMVIMGLNRNIRDHFSNELDWCAALDHNFVSSRDHTRTVVGELVYRAKYMSRGMSRKARAAIWSLAERLTSAVCRLSPLLGDGAVSLSYVPPKPDKQFDLPSELARIVSGMLSESEHFDGKAELVHSKLMLDKPMFKELIIQDKITEWNRLVSSGSLSLSRPVAGRAVVVIDDLYQSGATLWSFARFLKSVKAERVIGLVCEKSLRDTDNL